MMQAVRDWLARRNAFARALEFNRENTYRATRPGRWMCPACGSVHDATCSSAFSGPQFPPCCDFAAGHRLNKEHATEIA